MKKMLVVNPDTMHRQTQLFEAPEKIKTVSLDEKMREILNRQDITDEEKVKFYEDALAQYTTYRRKAVGLATPPPPPSSPQPASIPERRFVDDVVASVPKLVRGKAEQLAKVVLREMTWSPKGELIVNGQVLPGTHVVDLVGNAVRQRKSFRPAGRDAFIEGLSRINVPRELIGNREIWERWHPRIEEEEEAEPSVTDRPDAQEHQTPMSMTTMMDHARRRERYSRTTPTVERKRRTPDTSEHMTPMSMSTMVDHAQRRERYDRTARWLQYPEN